MYRRTSCAAAISLSPTSTKGLLEADEEREGGVASSRAKMAIALCRWYVSSWYCRHLKQSLVSMLSARAVAISAHGEHSAECPKHLKVSHQAHHQLSEVWLTFDMKRGMEHFANLHMLLEARARRGRVRGWLFAQGTVMVFGFP